MREKKFAKSLDELADEVKSTIPHAQNNGYLGVSASMSLDVASQLIEAVKSYQENINQNKPSHDCYDVYLGTIDFSEHVNEIDDKDEFSFTCPKCRESSVRVNNWDGTSSPKQ